mmetsp:Transcript_23806/g.63820  ORF Transcript_23806/g.63820 Transcript_23806/m.63820 type:complete len:258 (+) Transcript_23806:798-1571(+)
MILEVAVTLAYVVQHLPLKAASVGIRVYACPLLFTVAPLTIVLIAPRPKISSTAVLQTMDPLALIDTAVVKNHPPESVGLAIGVDVTEIARLELGCALTRRLGEHSHDGTVRLRRQIAFCGGVALVGSVDHRRQEDGRAGLLHLLCAEDGVRAAACLEARPQTAAVAERALLRVWHRDCSGQVGLDPAPCTPPVLLPRRRFVILDGVLEREGQHPFLVPRVNDRREQQVAVANECCHPLLELGGGRAVLVDASKINP